MEQFKAVLAEFEGYGGKGIVYGGCLRDTLCNATPIKDIDIAVKNGWMGELAIDAFAKAVPGTERIVQHIGYGDFPDVDKSVEVIRPGQLPVNFVVLSPDFPFTLKDVAERCDFGICQVSMGSSGEVYKSPAFLNDYRQYTFTYLRETTNTTQVDRSVRRYYRLADKYEGWLLRGALAPLRRLPP